MLSTFLELDGGSQVGHVLNKHDRERRKSFFSLPKIGPNFRPVSFQPLEICQAERKLQRPHSHIIVNVKATGSGDEAVHCGRIRQTLNVCCVNMEGGIFYNNVWINSVIS